MFHMVLKQDVYIIIVTNNLIKIIDVLHGASKNNLYWFYQCDLNAYCKMNNIIKFDKYKRDIYINL